MLSARGRLVKCLDLEPQATLASIVTITVIRSASGLQLTILALASTVVRLRSAGEPLVGIAVERGQLFLETC